MADRFDNTSQAVPGLSLPFSSEAEQSVLGAVLLAMALFALLPFVYMGLVSLTQKTVLDLRFDPAEFSFKNYARVFSNFNIGRNLLNSVIVTGGACVLNCIVCAMAAYGFAKKHFPGRDQLFMVYLATLMIPGQVTLIPVFTIIKTWADEHPHRADAAHPERVRRVSGAAVHGQRAGRAHRGRPH